MFNDILEVLKLLLAWPFIALIIFLTFIFTFRSPLTDWFSRLKIQYGNATFTSQATISDSTNISNLPDTPANLSKPSSEPAPENVDIQQWKAAAYLWEYRYLNHYLQFRTQQVLDWLYDRNDPVDVLIVVSVWVKLIPSAEERTAIVNALSQHYLISTEDKKLSITPKGREYVEYRGKFPPVSIL